MRASFWEHVSKSDGCWLWSGHVAVVGYGKFSRKYAHRLAYELLVAPIPAGHQVHHLCGNKLCVNPTHLVAVSLRQHAFLEKRLHDFGNRQKAKTHCPAGHEYTPENTYVYRTGRQCKACHKMHAKAHEERRKSCRR